MKCPNCDSPFESAHLFTAYENKWNNDAIGPIHIGKPKSIKVAMRRLRRKAIDVCYKGDEDAYRIARMPGYDDGKLPDGYLELMDQDDYASLWIDVCVKCNTTGEISTNLNEYFSAIEKVSKRIDSLAKKKAKAIEKKRAAADAKKKKAKEAEKKRLKKRLKELEKE